MASLIGNIIMIALGAVIFASVFMYTISETNTSTWSSGAVALWGTLGVIGVASFAYVLVRAFGLG